MPKNKGTTKKGNSSIGSNDNDNDNDELNQMSNDMRRRINNLRLNNDETDCCTRCGLNTNEPIILICFDVVCKGCLVDMRLKGGICHEHGIPIVGRDENYGRGLWYDMKSGKERENQDFVKKAIHFYEKAKLAEPELIFLQGKLGNMYMFSGQFKKAELHFLTAIDQDYKDARSLYSLAMIYNLHHNIHAALPYSENAVKYMGDISPEMQKDYRDQLKKIKAAVAKEPSLRFSIGDHVLANTYRGWEKGVIVDLWYMEESFELDFIAPYQIKLDKDSSFIYSPLDEDSHVKMAPSSQTVGEGRSMSMAMYKEKIEQFKTYKVSEKSLVGRKAKLRLMGPKSLHLNGKEVYIVEATDRIDTWIAYGLFIDDRIPASSCFPFYSFDGRVSECQWEMPFANAPPRQVPMFCNPFNSIYFNMFDIDWPDYCFTFKSPKEWSPIKDTDGMCRYWGLESELIKNHQDDRFSSDKVGLRTRRAQVPYGNIGPPEFQIATALSNWKLEVIMAEKNNRRALYGMSYTLRITLDVVEPPVYRDVICSGGIKLRTLSEKVIGPCMGWSTSYHGFLFTDPTDGSIYGQKKNRKGLDDDLFMTAHGFVSISSEKVRLADLVDKKGDFLFYVYDLGVRWEHTITVLELSSPPSSGAPHVICTGGSGACPPEDGNGLDENFPGLAASGFQDGVMSFDTLYCEKNGNAVYNVSIAQGGCLRDKKHPMYIKKQKDAVGATNKEGLKLKVFDHTHFDLDKTNESLKKALEIHGAHCLCCVESLVLNKGTGVCAVCANSNNLKQCSRCKATAYCSSLCQKKDWKKHKLECEDLKIAAKLVKARGDTSYTTGEPILPRPKELHVPFNDPSRKNFPFL